MPKRIIAFLLIIGCILTLSIVIPKVDREKREYDTLNAIPNASPFGFKGLFTLLKKAEPGRSIQFWQHALIRYPTKAPQVIWFLEPGTNLMIVSPAIKQHMQTLTKNGSHLVFLLNQKNLADHIDEQGLTLQERLNRNNTKEMKVYSPPQDILFYLNDWFDLPLEANRWDFGNSQDNTGEPQARELQVTSHYTTRPITSLGFRQVDHMIAPIEMRASDNMNPDMDHFGYFMNIPARCKPMLSTVIDPDASLIVECTVNKGTVTVVLNSELLRNYQLAREDNAALALALVERFPASLPIQIDGYSQGFRDNPDLITLMVQGQGRLLTLAGLLLLGIFVFNIVTTPPQKRYLLPNNVEEHYFTHQTFIHTLAQHLCGTGQWRALYDEALQLVKREIGPRLFHRRVEATERSPQEWINALVDNPFAELDSATVQALFNPPNPMTKQQYQELTVSLMACRQRMLHHDINTPTLTAQRGTGSLTPGTR